MALSWCSHDVSRALQLHCSCRYGTYNKHSIQEHAFTRCHVTSMLFGHQSMTHGQKRPKATWTHYLTNVSLPTSSNGSTGCSQCPVESEFSLHITSTSSLSATASNMHHQQPSADVGCCSCLTSTTASPTCWQLGYKGRQKSSKVSAPCFPY